MALVLDENGKRIRDTATTRVLRESYRKHGIVSYAEAADYAGVSIATICRWVCGKNPTLPLVRRTGSFRIRLLDLDNLLTRGCGK